MLGYNDRDAILAREHAGKLAPGAIAVFRPMIVVGGGRLARAVMCAEIGSGA